jgi:hypothetical protein
MKITFQSNKVRFEIVFVYLCLLWLISGCAFKASYGKFNPDEGIPSFIKQGVTTQIEVFDKLGEPTVYRRRAQTDTAIYNHYYEDYTIISGRYVSHELVIRFQNNVVSDIRIEKTGSGWGFLILPSQAMHANFYNWNSDSQ